MNMQNNPLLAVRNVSNAYMSRRFGAFGKKEEKQVLHNINLEIFPGEIHGLVGESGCGKTTLGKCILGLLDYQGEIEKTSMVQAVFQDPSGALNPVMQVGWILEEPLRVHHIGNKKEREKKVDQMLDLVGLDSSYKKRKPGELSSGQKQRISIGCALMLNPSLIIADEPVSALDVSVGAQILNLFRDLNKRLGLSLLFISHNLNLVYYLCDRISVMKQGRIIEQGSADEVYSNPKDAYTKELVAAVPQMIAN